MQTDDDSRFQVPINMAVKEPRARVVSGKAESDVIASSTNGYNISSDRVVVVVGLRTGALDLQNEKCKKYAISKCNMYSQPRMTLHEGGKDDQSRR